jgi:cyclopropane fatty-acyl-phospholipid synthase-like methyltransferase
MSAHPLQYCAAPFDAVAERYDETFTTSKIGLAQRASVWKELEKTFHPGDRVLELGCGTGIDASFLAQRGVTVVACDASPLMITMAQRRIQGMSDANRASVSLHLLRAEEVASLRQHGPFDGVFSNFGVLNCVTDLRPLAADLATMLRPGATALLCLMGSCCAWETGWYVARGEPKKAFRRLRRAGATARLADQTTVHVQYPTVRSLAQAFSPGFRLKEITGVGVSVPPSYLEPWAVRFPRWFEACVQADSVLGRCPGIRVLADHVMSTFEREEV